MGSAIRQRDMRIGVRNTLRELLLSSVGNSMGEHHLQVFIQGEVQKSIERMLTLCGSNGGDGLPFIVQIPFLRCLGDVHHAPVGAGMGPCLDIALHGLT